MTTHIVRVSRLEPTAMEGFEVVPPKPRGLLRKMLGEDPSAHEFMTKFGSDFVMFLGSAGRFHDLMSWPRLERLILEHEWRWPRLSLVKEGQPLWPNEFLEVRDLPLRGTRSRLLISQFIRQLRDGATIVINGVDELSEQLSDAVDSFSTFLGASVGINLYASFAASPGFALHEDPHDTFIFQCGGCKEWVVYGEGSLTEELADEISDSFARGAPLPAEPEPRWRGMLEDGTAIYIPKGWWHVASASTEPSLHLTLSIPSVGLGDLLRWLLDAAAPEMDPLRKTSTTLKNEEVIASEALVGRTVEAQMKSGFLNNYLSFRDAAADPRFGISLPGEITSPTSVTRSGDVKIRAALRQPLRRKRVSNGASGTTELAGAGKILSFPTDLESFVLRLLDGEDVKPAEAIGESELLATYSEEDLWSVVTTLVDSNFARLV